MVEALYSAEGKTSSDDGKGNVTWKKTECSSFVRQLDRARKDFYEFSRKKQLEKETELWV